MYLCPDAVKENSSIKKEKKTKGTRLYKERVANYESKKKRSKFESRNTEIYFG